MPSPPPLPPPQQRQQQQPSLLRSLSARMGGNRNPRPQLRPPPPPPLQAFTDAAGPAMGHAEAMGRAEVVRGGGVEEEEPRGVLVRLGITLSDLKSWKDANIEPDEEVRPPPPPTPPAPLQSPIVPADREDEKSPCTLRTAPSKMSNCNALVQNVSNTN